MKFTYTEYQKILSSLWEHGYKFKGYENYCDSDKTVILRHDIDISLDRAIRVAEIESKFGESIGEEIRSTYFILISSDFYNPFSQQSISAIMKIRELGHSIGLHFDEKKYFQNDSLWSEDVIIEYILLEKALLEKMVGFEISTVSMHTPSKKTLNANLEIPGLINSYSEEFFKEFKYISDSYHRWRENVWDVIATEPDRLHLLTHPFWYHNTSYTRAEVFNHYISQGKQNRYNLIEKNVLPPDVTLAQSLAEDE